MKKYFLLIVLLCLCFTERIYADNEVGFVKENDKTYYYENGEKIKGYQEIDGDFYYFDLNSGVMKTGMIEVEDNTYYFGEDGKRTSGIFEVNRYSYYFDEVTYELFENGEFYYDLNWYYANDKGQLQKGLVDLGDKTVYYGEDYKMKTGLVEIDGKKHLFDQQTGALINRKGQFYHDGYWYYADEKTGEIVTGLHVFDNSYQSKPKTVYYDDQGHLSYGLVEVDGIKRLFDEKTGALIDRKGQFSYNGDWYFADLKTGAIQTGLTVIGKPFQANPKTVYYNNEGKMSYGLQIIDEKPYYFRDDGNMVTNEGFWVGFTYYYFGENGFASETHGVTPASPVYYTQLDDRWRNIYFGNWTLGNTGCSPTSTAMILSGILHEEITPPDVASYLYNNTSYYNTYDHYGSYGMAPIAAAQNWGVNYRVLNSVEEIEEALKLGCIIKCSVGDGDFCSYPSTHAIVLAGYNDGNTTVYDPAWPYGTREFSVQRIWDQQSWDPGDRDIGVPFVAFWK